MAGVDAELVAVGRLTHSATWVLGADTDIDVEADDPHPDGVLMSTFLPFS